MSQGVVVGIYSAPEAGAPMQEVQQVRAVKGCGLEGDRYCKAEGSFSKEHPGHRQVTLINGIFFEGTTYAPEEARRNLVVEGVELNGLIGRKFRIGEATFGGVKYCDPCDRPTKLAEKDESFRGAFFDRGGLVAAVVEGGLIRVGDAVIPPPKGY